MGRRAALDFEGDARSNAPSDASLARVRALATKQVELERKLAEKALEIKTLSGQLNQISTIDLPNLMKEVGVASFTMTTGEEVDVKKHIEARITDERRDVALAWLRKNGHEGLIKNEVIASFGMGEAKKANALAEQLAKKGYVFTQKETVHPSTLKAFVREQIDDGKPLPREMFGVYEGEVAVVTPAGARKRGRKSPR